MQGTTPTRPAPRARKVLITIRLRPETLQVYRRMGKGWQTRVSDDLDQLAHIYRRPLTQKGAR